MLEHWVVSRRQRAIVLILHRGLGVVERAGGDVTVLGHPPLEVGEDVVVGDELVAFVEIFRPVHYDTIVTFFLKIVFVGGDKVVEDLLEFRRRRLVVAPLVPVRILITVLRGMNQVVVVDGQPPLRRFIIPRTPSYSVLLPRRQAALPGQCLGIRGRRDIALQVAAEIEAGALVLQAVEQFVLVRGAGGAPVEGPLVMGSGRGDADDSKSAVDRRDRQKAAGGPVAEVEAPDLLICCQEEAVGVVVGDLYGLLGRRGGKWCGRKWCGRQGCRVRCGTRTPGAGPELLA